MHISSQNLTDGRLSKFLHGRAWWFFGKPYESRKYHCEWCFGKMATGLSITLDFGNGDGSDGILFHISLPFLFSFWLGWEGFWRLKEEVRTGVAIHNGSLWVYPLVYSMTYKTGYPWYRKNWTWNFPWNFDWYSTEILGHQENDGKQTVEWLETKENKLCRLEHWEERRVAASRVSRNYPYAYILKSREIQHRTATVYVERRVWFARWRWVFFWRKKVSTCIDVKFDREVGEGSGSYKGGVTGCGFEMKWGETPERCLSRMEHEREFRR